MKKRIINFVILFFYSVICIYANGLGEVSKEIELYPDTQKHKEFEQEMQIKYNIVVAPISFGTEAYDFVYIDSDTIIIAKSLQLIEVKLSTNELKYIEFPEEWNEKVITGLRNLNYDSINNSIHMTVRERRINGGIGESYYILYLHNYMWETFDELGENIDSYLYDSENMLIYIQQYKLNESGPEKFELDPEWNNVIRTVTVFDLHKREVINCIELPHEIKAVLCMYGYPLKVLASVRSNKIENRYHYVIFDTATNTTSFFPEIIANMIDGNTVISSLGYYTSLNDEFCFLGIEYGRGRNSAIALLNLLANTREVVALGDFPYRIHNIKQIAEGKYGFMVWTPNIFGGHGQSFLCFWDYP